MREISIIIRTKNEQARLQQVLDAVFAQRCRRPFEIVVVDSGSTDNTLSILSHYDVRLVQMPASQFSYGRALNLGIAASCGEIIASLSAHAMPVDEHWLESLTGPLESSQIAGVYGRQIPWPDCNPLERRSLLTQFESVRRISREDYTFSSANCAIKRAIWREVPYNEILPGVEDREWAKCVQKLGYYICYEPAAAVFHSHNESCLQICRRSYREWYGHVGISPAFQVPLYRFIQSWKRDVLLDWRYVLANRESVYWLLMSPGYRFFQYMGAYFGQLKAKLQKSTARATARKKG